MTHSNVIPLIPQINYDRPVIDQVRALSTSQLKHMWDDLSGRWDVHCDEINQIMNERGEGRYVAV
jgi:hypothetical protein